MIVVCIIYVFFPMEIEPTKVNHNYSRLQCKQLVSDVNNIDCWHFVNIQNVKIYILMILLV